MSDHTAAPQHPKPFVSETLGSKSLYFSCSAVQSSMNLMQPDALVLEYTQTMMGFLMIKPKPQH
ncbi:MAG: transferase, partial [Aquabacterium sp.]|nr:transferase [Aquabacterium sp.]